MIKQIAQLQLLLFHYLIGQYQTYLPVVQPIFPPLFNLMEDGYYRIRRLAFPRWYVLQIAMAVQVKEILNGETFRIAYLQYANEDINTN